MDDTTDEPDDILIYVCREFPGFHIGGPDCFCVPTIYNADATSDEIMAACEAANRRN